MCAYHRYLLLCIAATPLRAQAHHSFAEIEGGVDRELLGEVVRVRWGNPHVRVDIEVVEDDGTSAVWELEGGDLNSLNRAGVTGSLVQVGQVIRAAGLTSTRRETYLAVSNILLPDGREVMMLSAEGPRWSDDVIGGRRTDFGAPEEFQAPVADIFRVWTTVQTNPPEFAADPPFTAAARAAYQAFDPITDDPVLRCVTPGMPEAISYIGPHPVEFIERDDGDITLRIESDDNTRIIHMGENARAAEQPLSPLGYSVGRWDGDDLIVTTTQISWPYFKLEGLVAAPQSEAVEIVERFALDTDAGELAYTLTATDPATFTEPVTAERYHIWRYRPGVEIGTYGCSVQN